MLCTGGWRDTVGDEMCAKDLSGGRVLRLSIMSAKTSYRGRKR